MRLEPLGANVASLTAYAPAPALLTSFANAGWGELAGATWQGVRSVLDALVRSLPYKSAAGFTSAPQIAARAGLSERWVRRCLCLLEDLEIIRWSRGQVVDGAPTPSHIRINKAKLVELIRLAWPAHSAKEARRRAATIDRIRAVKARYFKGKRGPRARVPVHAELSASPTTPKGWSSPQGATPHPVDNYSETRKAIRMKIPCAHNPDVRECHKCVSTDSPPAGYVFDFTTCQDCNYNKAGHERMVRVERSIDGTAHMFVPQLRRGSNAKPLPGVSYALD